MRDVEVAENNNETAEKNNASTSASATRSQAAFFDYRLTESHCTNNVEQQQSLNFSSDFIEMFARAEFIRVIPRSGDYLSKKTYRTRSILQEIKHSAPSTE